MDSEIAPLGKGVGNCRFSFERVTHIDTVRRAQGRVSGKQGANRARFTGRQFLIEFAPFRAFPSGVRRSLGSVETPAFVGSPGMEPACNSKSCLARCDTAEAVSQLARAFRAFGGVFATFASRSVRHSQALPKSAARGQRPIRSYLTHEDKRTARA